MTNWLFWIASVVKQHLRTGSMAQRVHHLKEAQMGRERKEGRPVVQITSFRHVLSDLTSFY